MRIHFLFFTFSATANFDIGTVQLPHPIYLAGVEGSNSSIGNSGWITSGKAPLYLNMGSRATATTGFQGRGIGDDQQNESFTIDHITGDPNSTNGETVQITAFGHSQTYSHVSAIYGFGGSGDDTLIVDKGVLAPVYLDGGDGNDALMYDGSGGATLTGGSGGDVIIARRRRGRRDQRRRRRPTATTSSTTAPTRPSRSTAARATTRSPAATAAARALPLRRRRQRHHRLARPERRDLGRQRRRHDHDEHADRRDDDADRRRRRLEHARRHFTNGADTIHVTHTNDIGDPPLRSGGSFSASNIHAVSLALGTGRDTITVDNLSGSSVTSLTIDVGANDHAADAVTLDGSNNGDSFTVSGSDPNAGIQIVHTVSTNVGWIQQIYVQHTVARRRRHPDDPRRQRRRHDGREPARVAVELVRRERASGRPRRADADGRRGR